MSPERNFISRQKNNKKPRVSFGVKVAAIIPSAGSGSRMRLNQDKPFVKLCGKELILHCLKPIQDFSSISEIIIVAKKKNIPRIKKLLEKHKVKKVKTVVEGGSTRSKSVSNGLSKVSPGIDYILIHDCARPIIDKGLIKRAIDGAKRYGASLCAVPAKATVKQSDLKGNLVRKTLDRRIIWHAQTPQVIKKSILHSAYKKAGRRSSFTDDAALVENIGKRVKLVMGSYSNIKITTPEDVKIAEALIKR